MLALILLKSTFRTNEWHLGHQATFILSRDQHDILVIQITKLLFPWTCHQWYISQIPCAMILHIVPFCIGQYLHMACSMSDDSILYTSMKLYISTTRLQRLSQHILIGLCNYIPEKRKFSGILCFRQQRSRAAAAAAVRRVTISLLAR